MSLEFMFEWGLRSLIWNPAAEVRKHLAPAKSEDDTIANTFALFKENPGLLFAVAAIGAKYCAFNPAESKEYGTYLKDRAPAHLAALWKANPGLIGGVLMSLEFVFEWGLRSLIWNPSADIYKHLIPAKSEEDSIANTFAVFKENPGLLFAVAAVGAKYFAFNPATSEEYGVYLDDRSLTHFANLWKANPGLIGGALISLEFIFEWGLRSLIWNSSAEVAKHLVPSKSEEDSIANTLAVFKENPGLLFAVTAIGAKYFGFNPAASAEYGAYLQDRSPFHFAALWKANPGLIGGAIMSLEFVLEWGLRSLIWNPSAEVAKHLAPAKSEEDSIANTLAVFKENPGLIFAVAAIGVKYFDFNPSASKEYEAFLQDRSQSHFIALWKANPGLIGGIMMSFIFVFEWSLRSLIWNPTADVRKHLAPARSEDDSIANTFAVFKENPGLLFAVAAIGAKYFAFNPSASAGYGAYLQDRSLSHFSALWKANPGLIGGALMSLEFVLEWGLRSLIWNPAADVAKHLIPAKSEEDSIANTFAVFKENPGLLFAVAAIGSKYFAFNPSASAEYRAYLHDRSPAHFAALWKANPGLISGALMSLEFVFEWSLRSLIWNPAADVAKHLIPAKSDEDSIANTLAVFKENPGLLFAVTAIGAKYFGFNPSASKQYGAYLETVHPLTLPICGKPIQG